MFECLNLLRATKNIAMEIIKFTKKHKFLSLFFFISTTTIFLTEYLLADIPQFWKFGHTSGEILSNLALGYITSLVFYILVVYIKDLKDQRNIAPRISKAIIFILMEGDSLERQLHKGQYNGRDPLIIEEICKNIKLFEINYSSINRKLSWVDYLTKTGNECKYFIDKVFKLQGVDSDLIRILTELDDSIMLAPPKLVVGLPDKDQRTMEPLTESIIEFFRIIMQLEKYWDENFSYFEDHAKLRNSKK